LMTRALSRSRMFVDAAYLRVPGSEPVRGELRRTKMKIVLEYWGPWLLQILPIGDVSQAWLIGGGVAAAVILAVRISRVRLGKSTTIWFGG